MWSAFLFIFPFLISLQKVSGTTCYISDLYISPQIEVFNRTHKIQNCREQGTRILPVGITLPENSDITCFKIVGSDPHGNAVDIKGCIPKGGCEFLKKSLVEGSKMKENRIIHLTSDTQCYECEGDNCNSVSKFRPTALIIAFFLFINSFGIFQ